MRLTRYLFLFSLTRFIGAFGVLLLIYAAIDFVEASSLVKGGLQALLCAYPFKLPSIITHILPLACAVGAVTTLANLRSGGEWEALLATGLSPVKLLGPLLLVSFVCSGLALPFAGTFAPVAYARYEIIAGLKKTDNRTNTSGWSKQGSWLTRNNDDGTMLAIERSDTGKATRWLSLEQCDGDFERVVSASWSAKIGFSESVTSVESLPSFGVAPTLPLTGADGLFGADKTDAGLEALARDLEERGLDSTSLTAQLSLRKSLAVSCLLVTALALVFSLLFPRGREVGLIGLALVVSAGYWMLLCTAWNGAASGLLSNTWVSVGVSLSAVATVFVVGAIAVRATPPRR